MEMALISGRTVGRERRDGSLVMLDVHGFPLRLNGYLVQRRNKRPPPVALAFRGCLLSEGSAWVDRIVPVLTPAVGSGAAPAMTNGPRSLTKTRKQSAPAPARAHRRV
jgi:hypothetical protein